MPANDADHRGSTAWRARRELARAAGSDISPLVDMDQADRETRLRELSRSEVSDERALAFYQEGAAFVVGDAPDDLGATLEEQFANLLFPPPLPPLLPMPDVSWNSLVVRSSLVMHARSGGHVLVVRESGSRPGRYYPVVDGHHLSWRGGPESYVHLLDAIIAANAAAEPERTND